MSTIHSKKNLLKRTAKLEKELAARSYALKIASALEKVSIAAMSMRRSKDLSGIGSLIFKELKKLGFTALRNSEVVINNDAKETITSYYYSDYGVTGMVELDYRTNPIVRGWAKKMKKVSDAFARVIIREKEMKQWRKYREEMGYKPDPKLNKAKTVYYYSYSIGSGALSISSFKPVSKEQIEILQRFRNVFNLCYRRYADIVLAEAQAREANIEAALERVRSRSMAMHKSDELREVVAVLFAQLQQIGFDIKFCTIALIDKVNSTVEFWLSGFSQEILPESYYVPNLDHPFYQNFQNTFRQGTSYKVFELAGEAKRSYDKLWFTLTDFKNLPEPVKKPMMEMERVVLSCAFTQNGMIQIGGFEPLSDLDASTVQRFAKVFEQTYTRFLDLQKAEAQARESQIELALERVRARTMAMQRSDELAEVATVLFQQVKALGVSQWVCGFSIWEIGDKEFTWYPGSPDGEILTHCKVPLTEHPVFISYDESRLRGDELFVYEKEGEFQAGHYRYMMSLPGMRELGQKMLDAGLQFPTFQIDHLANFSHGNLIFITYEPVPEMHDVFKRFAKVFEQTYTRFLDLQKAEAQAREAQIELALERVRARTMAMQKSDELAEAAQLLYHEFGTLGINTITCGYMFINEEKNIQTAWVVLPDGTLLPNFIDFPLTGDHVLNKRYEDWKQKKPLHIFEIQGEVNKEHHKFLADHVPPFVVKDIFSQLPDKIVFHCANFSNGYLLILGTDYFSPDDQQTIIRFAKVFEMTYRRFLDLQKAEAQVKESQIQLALERVRARTMAMHKSEELAETAQVLFHQLQELGGIPDRIAIGVADESEGVVNFWSTDQSGSHIDKSFKARLNERTVMSKTYQAWKDHKKSLVIDLQGDDVKEWIQFAREEMGVVVKDEFIKDRRVHNFAFFSHGWILVTTHEPQAAETIQILERFAAVFSLTYRRFLDLQRAETQAREAQIEAALERVRARSMAMHHSTELHAAAEVLFQQLRIFGGNIMNAGIALCTQDADEDEYWLSSDTGLRPVISIPHTEDPIQKKLYENWKNKSEFYSIAKGGDELRAHYNYLQSVPGLKPFFEEGPDWSFPTWQKWHAAYFSHGYLFMITLEPYEEEKILVRLARVFEQAYTRFLDLKRAEAQAREAQIEAALERVRSKTMAMHNSNDVGETVAAMFAEFVHLGIHTNRCGILIFNDQYIAEVWTARSTPGGNAKLIIGKLDLDAHKMLRSVYNAWKAKETFYQYDLLDNDLVQYYTAINNSKFYPTQFDLNALPSKEFHSDFFFIDGAVFSFTNEPVEEEHAKIIKRFALVFGQTYRRYLDLQKAEAQTREAQIEAGLERVRARTMAMHTSDDVSVATATMFTELEKLGVENFRGGITNILTNRTQEVWSVNNLAEERVLKAVGAFNIDAHPFWQLMFKEWEAKKDFLHYFLAGQEKEEYIKILNATQGYLPQAFQQFPDVHFQVYYFNEGGVWTNSLHPHSEEDKQVVKRFASVFSLTFRRYQDLKKAEAQAREAQIETSLERMRSKTMAMHSSDDVTSATATMFTELERLGIENMRCGIAHYLEDHKMEVWSVSNLADGKVVRGAGLLDTNSIPFWKIFYSTWQKKEDFLYYLMAGKEKEDYFKKISTLQNYLSQSIEDVPDLSIQTYYFAEGSVWAFSLKPHSEEDKQVMKRFASVFSLTFRRYQDLKKAEAQAREATIEAALEKVRGKAMAMHNSNDLSVTASMVFTELRKLGINPIRCGVGLLNKESRKAQLYSATSSSDGDNLSLVGWAILSEHPVLEKIYESWLDNEEYYPQLQGEQMRSYYQLLLKGLPVAAPAIEDDKKQYGHFLPFSVGCLYAWSEAPYNETEIKILKRFATIIDLTFRRYMELQTSEVNAREAVKQAALDRVRAEIASMRTISDLDRITPLIWNELTILGLPFIRCGVFIMDNSQKLIHTFLSTPDGKAIGAFHLPYDTPGSFADMVIHWENKKTFITHWGEIDMMVMADILVKQGAIATKEQYLRSLPGEGFYLHFLPFLQGMLYVANLEKLNDEQIELIQHVADAFSTAYARYEDFNKLEAAKQQVEKTLTDLKQAQTLLVQSEKMASLGELTAGIAHEIQNPLNFVNNFSDVSNELLDEMKEELAKGNVEGAIAIAQDVRQNLEKINHHGKRADGIVKGMLQHSRTSSSQKEMTNINTLADEYLRLAYHGLRAKDKSFNAKFETSFDKNVGEINIIPQDIGRVILNLINNAFYAVSEKKRQKQDARLTDSVGQGYEPTVTLTTVKDNGKIGIKVKDNGNGITQKVLDKIFQPFFTTKPTGQGTGLGLSLAYDIVKAHGGDIKVETKEGEGSEFSIQLPG